ncbi:hypothetical protein B296_00046673 [Ensete ventricosum]|uniref:Uncharacterized protein n=1 Tax=Ensete ventricosum TaxID=4639 RepID=A0A426X8P9_ENSVE|nr:hypothetical protein B296_00046673 [Ensete ventricosum]
MHPLRFPNSGIRAKAVRKGGDGPWPGSLQRQPTMVAAKVAGATASKRRLPATHTRAASRGNGASWKCGCPLAR